MEKLQQIKEIKSEIKAALIEKGQTPGDKFSEYPDHIREIGLSSQASGHVVDPNPKIEIYARYLDSDFTYPSTYYLYKTEGHKLINYGFSKYDTSVSISTNNLELSQSDFLTVYNTSSKEFVPKDIKGFGFSNYYRYGTESNTVVPRNDSGYDCRFNLNVDPEKYPLFFGTDIRHLFNTSLVFKNGIIPDNCFRACGNLYSLQGANNIKLKAGKYSFANSSYQVNRAPTYGVYFKELSEGCFKGTRMAGSASLQLEYGGITYYGCDFRDSTFNSLPYYSFQNLSVDKEKQLLIILPETIEVIEDKWNDGCPDNMVTVIFNSISIPVLSSINVKGIYVVPDEELPFYIRQTNWNALYELGRLKTVSSFESGEYLLTSLELDEPVELDYIYASEGKVWKRKTDGIIMSEKICLGEEDSIENYEEIDEPLRDTGVIHGDFSYLFLTPEEDEEPLNE